MSNVHIRFIEDEWGDVTDIAYYHCACAEPLGIKEWPCPEAIDYVAYCFACGEIMDAIPLTEDGLKDAMDIIQVADFDTRMRRMAISWLSGNSN